MAVREKTQGGDRQGPGLPTRILDVFEIIPAESNPRKQLKPGSKDFEDLKRSIETFGLVAPLVWNKRSEKLIGGHQRLLVLQHLGWTEVEVTVVDLNKTDERLLNITLNNVEGSWDNSTLAGMLAELATNQKVDVTITGFSGAELDKLLTSAEKLEGEHEFTEELLEAHNYVVLYFDNEMDWQVAQDVLNIHPAHALDSKPGYVRKGTGRVIDGAPIIKKLKGKK